MKFKSTKVLATAVAVTIIATGVAGCNRDGGAGSSASGTVVFAVSTQTNPFFVQLVDGAKKEAKAKGVNLQVQDASDDAATQANQLANAVSTSAKVVIVNPTDSDAVAPSVKALNKAKIPVITVDRSSSSGDVASFIASDNIAGGIDAAKKLAEIMGDRVKSSTYREPRVPRLPVTVVRDSARKSPNIQASKWSPSRLPILIALRLST